MNPSLSRPIHSTLVSPDSAQANRRVVFLHGLFGRGKNFTRIAQALLPEAESLLVDLPNHGESGWTEGFSYVELADLVAQHIRDTSEAALPIDLVGHSMGGKVAMVLALRHPELVRRLAVLDIAPTQATSARGEFDHLLGSLAGIDLSTLSKRREAQEQLRGPIPEDGVRGFLLQNLKQNENGFFWEPNLKLLWSELDTIMSFPDTHGASFDGRVLWLGGGNSNYVQDADEPTMRALFPKTIRMTVKDAGHWVHSEKPDEVIAALRALVLTR